MVNSRLSKCLLATFEFDNSGYYDITEQSNNEVYIKIQRFLRRSPLPGMKQPTPHGGMLGFEVRLSVKHDGLRAAKYRFDLLSEDTHIQSDMLDDRGEYHNLHISKMVDDPIIYTLKVFEPVNEEYSECNTDVENKYEQDRLGNSGTHLRDSAE